MPRYLQLFIATLGLVTASQQTVMGQTPVLGGLVETRNYYNGYGAGYYGRSYGPEERFYGSGLGGGYGPYDFSYSGYGNGPYGAGMGSEHEFLSSNRYDSKAASYDGYGNDGYYGTAPIRRYNPYGFGVPKSRRHDW